MMIPVLAAVTVTLSLRPELLQWRRIPEPDDDPVEATHDVPDAAAGRVANGIYPALRSDQAKSILWTR